MSKKLIINAIEPREVRAVMIEDGRATQFFMERSEKKYHKGDIFKAKVVNMENHIQAAFVEIAPHQHGFLSVNDVIRPDGGLSLYAAKKRKTKAEKELEEKASTAEKLETEVHEEISHPLDAEIQTEKAETKEIEAKEGEAEEEGAKEEGESSPEVAEAKVEEKVELSQKEKAVLREADRKKRYPRIDEVLRRGQEMVVQITKEGIGNKAPVVTTMVSLAGRYLVLALGGERSGISRQIEKREERQRLRGFLDKAKIPEGVGVIVRTAAIDIPIKDLQADLKALLVEWRDLKKKVKTSPVPFELRGESGLLARLVRDFYRPDVTEIHVDTREGFEETQEFFKKYMKDELDRVHLFEGRSIFKEFDLNKTVDSLFKRTIPLQGGGSLVFDQGEAMMMVDVNSGQFREGKDDEDMTFKLNLLAAREIALQVRLRDIGGLILVDFVDMRKSSHRAKVEKEFQKAFKGDKSKVNINRISSLGVLEMSRQRTRDNFKNTLYSSCKECEGTGRLPSVAFCAISVLRELRENLSRYKGAKLNLLTTARTALEVLNRYKSDLIGMEKEGDVEIQIKCDDHLNEGEFRLENPPKSLKPSKQTKQPEGRRNHREKGSAGSSSRGRNNNRNHGRGKDPKKSEENDHFVEKPGEPLGVLKVDSDADKKPEVEVTKEAPRSEKRPKFINKPFIPIKDREEGGVKEGSDDSEVKVVESSPTAPEEKLSAKAPRTKRPRFINKPFIPLKDRVPAESKVDEGSDSKGVQQKADLPEEKQEKQEKPARVKRPRLINKPFIPIKDRVEVVAKPQEESPLPQEEVQGKVEVNQEKDEADTKVKKPLRPKRKPRVLKKKTPLEKKEEGGSEPVSSAEPKDVGGASPETSLKKPKAAPKRVTKLKKTPIKKTKDSASSLKNVSLSKNTLSSPQEGDPSKE